MGANVDYEIITNLPNARPALQIRSAANVWNKWRNDEFVDPTILVPLFVAISVLIIVAAGSTCMLPTILNAGVGKAWATAFRLSVASLGLLCFLVGLISAACAVADNMIDLGVLPWRFRSLFEEQMLLLLAMAAPFVCLWWSRAATAARLARDAAIELPPTCEGCGYNLTHRPETRCPECGLATPASLDPDLARPGPSWLRSPGVTSWLETTFDVLATPGRHYRRLPVRDDERRLRTFEFIHCVALGLVTAPAIVLVELAAGGVLTDETLPRACAAALLAGTLGWLVNQMLGGLAMSAWSVCRTIPDIGAGRRVVACEAAFLWPVLFHNVLALAALAIDVGPGVFLGGLMVHPGAVVLVSGNVVLLIFWLWRYRIAGRAIRWSNF